MFCWFRHVHTSFMCSLLFGQSLVHKLPMYRLKVGAFCKLSRKFFLPNQTGKWTRTADTLIAGFLTYSVARRQEEGMTGGDPFSQKKKCRNFKRSLIFSRQRLRRRRPKEMFQSVGRASSSGPRALKSYGKSPNKTHSLGSVRNIADHI